jgi:hypothetical protein
MAKDATIFGNWQHLSGSLAANLADLTHVEGAVRRFGDVTTRTQAILTQQTALAAAKQATSKELRDLVIEGQRLATMLRQALKQQYGIRSEKLAEFGVQPFRGRPSKKKPLPPPEEPATAPPAR